MQIGSTTNSSSRAKATGKASKRAKPKTEAGTETLRLKAKHLVATPTGSTASDITSMIATAAYYRAAQRGFEPGHELDDWLEAEHQVRSITPS